MIGVLSQPLQIDLSVPGTEEDRVTPITTMGDVVRTAGDDDSRKSGHWSCLLERQDVNLDLVLAEPEMTNLSPA